MGTFIVASMFTSHAFAQASKFEGFYLQTGLNYTSDSLKVNGNSVDTPADNNDEDINLPTQSFSSTALNLAGGYIFPVARDYLIGLGADYTSPSQTYTINNFQVTNSVGNTGIAAGTTVALNGATAKISNRYSIFITPSFLIDAEKMAFLKLGYSSAKTTLVDPSTATVTIGGASTTSANSPINTAHNSINGYIFGVGYKQFISNNLYGYGEANYIGYGKNTSSTISPTNNNTANSTTTIKSTLTEYSLILGVGYKF